MGGNRRPENSGGGGTRGRTECRVLLAFFTIVARSFFSRAGDAQEGLMVPTVRGHDDAGRFKGVFEWVRAVNKHLGRLEWSSYIHRRRTE